MNKRKILFYGDSNTYGFDPRGFICGRYPENAIWTALVSDSLGEQWEVINKGMNGRRLPAHEESYEYIKNLLKDLSPNDVFAVMLGSNDLLSTIQPDAKAAAAKADAFIKRLTLQEDHPQILLLAPPYIKISDTPGDLYKCYLTESVRMNKAYREIAVKYKIHYADTAIWHLSFAFDGIHLSEKGHREFAQMLIPIIKSTFA